MEDWICSLIIVVVIAIVFWLIYRATKLDAKNFDMAVLTERVNLMWALLIFWILAQTFWWAYITFFSPSARNMRLSL